MGGPGGIVLKWTLTEGIARWQMATGTTLLEGWVRKLGGWIQWVFLAYLLLFTVVTAAMLSSACGIAGAALVPLGGLDRSRLVWGVIHSLAGAALVMWGGYELLKRVLAVCVGAMFGTVTLTAVLLRPDWAEVGARADPVAAAGSAGWIVGLIGAIGGTMALITYGYWIREEGRTGRRRVWRRAGLTCCFPMRVIGLFGIAVVIVGSRGQVQRAGRRAGAAAGRPVGVTLGPPGKWIFLVGFWAAVFSALLGVWQSLPYLFADFLRLRRGRAMAERAADGFGPVSPVSRSTWFFRPRFR